MGEGRRVCRWERVGGRRREGRWERGRGWRGAGWVGRISELNRTFINGFSKLHINIKPHK